MFRKWKCIRYSQFKTLQGINTRSQDPESRDDRLHTLLVAPSSVLVDLCSKGNEVDSKLESLAPGRAIRSKGFHK